MEDKELGANVVVRGRKWRGMACRLRIFFVALQCELKKNKQ